MTFTTGRIEIIVGKVQFVIRVSEPPVVGFNVMGW